MPQRWREQDLPGSGLWVDLGSHLLDQALCLWGMPGAMSLDTACMRDGALVNDWFHAVLHYEKPGSLRVILHASTLVTQPGPRWAVHGTLGSFTKFGLDPQEDSLKTGRLPQLDALGDWGADPHPGEVLHMAGMAGVTAPVAVRRVAPAPPGNYLNFYANLRDHLRGQADLLVTPAQVGQVMQLLVLGEQSASQGRVLKVAGR